MALDLVSRVLTKYEADTSQHISELTKLKGKITDAQKAELESQKSREESYSKWLENLANVNQALELGGKAIGVLKDSWKEHEEIQRLSTAAGTANIEKLRAASLGLRTEHELLTFAAKTQHGVYKLTQDQMETAQKAMVALTRAGFDQEEVTNKITDALVKGKAEGLDDFGIAIQSTGDKTKDFTALMGALADKASGVAEGGRTASEEMTAMGVSVSDSFSKVKQSIGQLVEAMGPLLSALASAIGAVADVVSWSLKLPGRVVDSVTGEAYTKSSGSSKWDEYNKREGRDTFGRKLNVYNPYAQQNPFLGDSPFSYQDFNPWEQGDMGGTFANGGRFDQGAFASALGRIPKGSGGPRASRFSDVASLAGTDTAGGLLGFGSTFYGALGQAGQGIDAATLDQALAEHEDLLKRQAEMEAAAKAQRQQSFLETTFGKLEDFNLYGTAFQTLTGSVTSAMDAWITGSMSVGDAIKKSIGSALTSLASQMAIESLKHGAYAIGSLAFGDFAGAAAHGVAAAEFGAAAVAAGVAARAMGHGGTDYGKAKSGGASAGGGTRPKEDAGSTAGSGSHSGNGAGAVREIHTFTYLDPFSTMDETARKAYAQRMVNKAVAQSSARR